VEYCVIALFENIDAEFDRSVDRRGNRQERDCDSNLSFVAPLNHRI